MPISYESVEVILKYQPGFGFGADPWSSISFCNAGKSRLMDDERFGKFQQKITSIVKAGRSNILCWLPQRVSAAPSETTSPDSRRAQQSARPSCWPSSTQHQRLQPLQPRGLRFRRGAVGPERLSLEEDAVGRAAPPWTASVRFEVSEGGRG